VNSFAKFICALVISLLTVYVYFAHCRTDTVMIVDYGDGTVTSPMAITCSSNGYGTAVNLCTGAYQFCTFTPTHAYSAFGKIHHRHLVVIVNN
jgi:hypothetical protein